MDSSRGGPDAVTNDAGRKADLGPGPDNRGADSGASDAAPSCTVQTAGPFGPRAARSLGYKGTLSAYSALYNVACTGLPDCVAACTKADGTSESCEKGSECAVNPDRMNCLPPTYWRYETSAMSEDGTCAEQTLVVIGHQDALVLSDFGVQVPQDATIRGIQFDVLRGTDDPAMAVDYSIRVMRAGEPVGIDRKQTGEWPVTLSYASYGGPSDIWGVTWTPADIASSDFGISIAALFTGTGGNARAYVDYVRVLVSYTRGNCQ